MKEKFIHAMKPIMCLLSISLAYTVFADTIKNNDPLPPIIIGTPHPSGGNRMPAKTYIFYISTQYFLQYNCKTKNIVVYLPTYT